jgi:hypothetical protein
MCTHPYLKKREKAKDSPKKNLKLSLSDTVCVFSADKNGQGCVDGCITVYVGEWS